MADQFKFNPFTGKLDNAGSASAGTVTTVSVVTANGVSGSVANPTSTPAITLTLGDITPTSVVSGGLVTGTLTNSTGLPISTGVTGLASGIAAFLGTPSSANLKTAVTDETGSGALVFGTSPTFTTDITTPLIYGGSGSSGNLVLQSTSNSTRGTVQTPDLVSIGTAAQTFAATTPFYINVGAGNCSVTTGAITVLRYGGTLTVSGNSASTIAALFNSTGIITDDGTSRIIGPGLFFASQFTYTATVASGLTCNDLAGIPAYTSLYHSFTLNRTGSGTGAITTMAGVYISTLANIGVGWTVTNYCGILIDKPTVGGTMTNFYGVKNNGAAGTNQWFLYETGGMQSSHKGNLRLGDNTAPTTLLDIAGKTTLTSAGLLTKYNNVATTAWGTLAVYASGRSTAQTAAVASVSTYTCGAADGTFLVSSNVLVTAFTAGTFTVTCAYTDESNTARTLTLNFSSLGGTIGVNIASAAAFEGIPLHIRVKASTAITIASTGTFTSLTYNIEGYIAQIG